MLTEEETLKITKTLLELEKNILILPRNTQVVCLGIIGILALLTQSLVFQELK